MASACWSGWTVPGQVFWDGSTSQHENGKFQYGPVVVQVWPALLVSKTSSRSRKTWLSLRGSTMIAWLYHACEPGVPYAPLNPTVAVDSISAYSRLPSAE